MRSSGATPTASTPAVGGVDPHGRGRGGSGSWRAADFEGVLRGVFGLDLAGMPRAHLAAGWGRQADGYAAYQAKKTARA
ncbi:MAG: hypothetical protein IPP00_17055 [Actinomycetales bacterium]|uniref:Uncharacterized protein n=1 Tax=Candidatus Phosphoribacter hodrii TaxID=2953743 RepID=A0A9D7TAE3_9MICO|nr:hypothetical protein [Candidatus Phosphoribacter hodrii]